ncbi:ABC transporter substrate-binding protein [Falsigemmobacter intermedius]|uniref:ABC transporter substrate-binding protein n=1 Tax=Falsigemmobacter intermedius TaxID=1553448 RepID=A0A451GHD5_9RHOB|nr:ABC transporter substrate-binding protein [Falsigemmobacter intermedius]RWY37670.1 ABC transporter substrate-binding protein [Falsigemmobacter intermedius]
MTKPLGRIFASVPVMLAFSTGLAFAQGAAKTLSYDDYDLKDVCSDATPGVGGTFHLRAYSQGAGFDPAHINFSVEAGRAVYGSLTRWDVQSQSFQPYYAESLTGNEAGDEWVLKLPAKAGWSDGTPLTAEAVKKSVERFLNPDFPNTYVPMLKLISEMVVQDDQTLVIRLSKPWGTLPWIFSQPPGMIVNPKVLDAVSAKDLGAAPPAEAGLGAFTFAEWVPNSHIVLKKKADWWNGRICLDEVNVTWSAGGQANYEAMVAGQVHYFRSFDGPAVVKADANPDMRLYRAPWVASTTEMNHAGTALKDPRVRQAVVHAMNGAIINQRIWEGIGSESHTLVPPGVAIHPETAPLVYDAEKAKELVAAAKADGWDGKIRFSINNTPGNVNQGILQQAMAKAVGIEIERDELQIGDYMQKTRVQKNFEMSMGAIYLDESCSWCPFSLYGSGHTGNWMSHSDANIDAALDVLRAAQGPEEIRSAMNGLQAAWNEAVPAGVTGWLANAHIISNKARGVLPGATNAEVHIDRAYLTE